MQVSRSAYYQYLEPPEQSPHSRQVEEKIVEVFTAHKRRYGLRRLCAERKEGGIQAGKYKCRKVMKQHGLKAIQPGGVVPRTTDSRHPYPISPNLLLDRAAPARPNEVWVGDISYVQTRQINPGLIIHSDRGG